MSRATATFNGQIIAEADNFETVEGNIYFPPSSIKTKDALSEASLTTVCPWKGTASYYNISVNGDSGIPCDLNPMLMSLGKEAKDAAWYYPNTITERAEKIKDHVAFCECLDLLTRLITLWRVANRYNSDKTKVEVKVE